MNIQIFGITKSFDTKKAQRWFQERGISFQAIDVKQKGFSRGELESVLRAVGGMQQLLDPQAKEAASLAYLALEQDRFEKLLEQPLLCRLPVVRNGKQATVGYQPATWEAWHAQEKA